ncbi:hypothetical protein HYH02_010077 [Chlamydomonas schloesseri]|uniref:FAM192A/Fyv6 N-terminal domain-containing protein n=1 Tax=Chlamydomonas schloesseri TaxID=2026947 RepID=A0A835T9E4_9CHLO|nr:hypothetical protein HYH02_010077 [Chlamydomonas schloesseri]|eukprot:KAG2441234.1 hypothetical protein HYH02_010077 [Chlamydomonas schloesseri]
MTEERRVDLVRVPAEERYYEREAVLGRDAASVFPTRAKEIAEGGSGGGGLDVESIKEALGARKFISETELETIRSTRGATADDGAVAVDKPLAEILRERKAAKDAEHEDKWRQMKVGKNRPLDPDELLFLDSVAEAEAARERAWSELERAELEAFKAAVRERGSEAPAAGVTATAAAAAGSGSAGATSPSGASAAEARPALVAKVGVPSVAAAVLAAPKPVIKPLVKIKPKAASNAAPAAATATGRASGGAVEEPPAKRAKAEGGEDTSPSARLAGGGGGGGGLAGLLGGYGSDEDED